MGDTLKKKHKRSFVDAWLNDDRVKSWIQKVPFDDSLFHCIICNKNFSCNANIVRHADSAFHKNNNKENINDENVQPPHSPKKYKKTFQFHWLEKEEFKVWLREVPNDVNSFFCSLCKISIVGGLSQIERHAESAAHRNNYENSELFKKTNNIENEENENLLPFNERKQRAEIRYAALIAENNIPHQTAQEILKFFQDIGKDTAVLRNMSMGRTKCKSIISNVLGPMETKHIATTIRNTKFSVFIDETSDICNEKWMTFLVRYVCPETLDVRSQLVTLINIDATDCSADKLFNAFQSEMYKLQIPFLNILALSCDNASVMTGKYVSFKKRLQEKCKNLLTFTCPCHSAALAAHAACLKLPAVCDEFLRKISAFINNSPKRTAIFKEFSDCFQDTHRKILKLCDTRWLSHYSCIDRVLESWNTIKYFLNEIVVSEKSQSAQYLLKIVQNVQLKAYFLFLKYVLNFFNQFNAFFQAIETRIHLLQPKSVQFLVQLSQNFVKPELIKTSLFTVAFHDKENHKPIDSINLGFECEEYLEILLKEGHANEILPIRENCLQFYVVAAEEIRKRLPITNEFLYKLKVFTAYISLFDAQREKSFPDVCFVAHILSDFDEDSLKKEWLALHSDFNFEEKHSLSKLTFDNMWKTICQRQSDNMPKYPNLTSLVNAVRSLPNSNADSERTFSVLSTLKTKTRNSLSSACVNATCVFKSALKAKQETALKFSINEEHLSLMSAEKLYSASEKKKKKSLTLYAADDNDMAGPSSSNDI